MPKIAFSTKVSMKKTWEKQLAEYEALLLHHQNENNFRKNYSSNTSFSKEEVLEKIDMLKALVAAAEKEFAEYIKSRKVQRG